ncbi:ATP-binding protein [Ramlibacter sp. XY19]|uniref:hybrid sensor histidine kinase/response regulator n=1 Tax=Ramlibacter paludis TaxID=2908000 RepID=UPI0023DA54B4|nr:hybrid sensor histidine kinase/response regulator [Ramlibacter paludis]MCG2593617.1 ATP-binding protein [Ramlibacter paludis]
MLPWLRVPARPVIALALLAWLLVAAVATAAVWHERTTAIARARLAAAATTALMEAQTASTLQVVDLVLQEVAGHLAAEPLPRHDAELRALMQARLKDMPYVRALFVIGPDGFILHDTDYPKTPNVSLADRGYFVAHRADLARVRDLSAPLQSRSGTGWFVAATRRLGDGQRFEGIVVAALQLRYFADLYQRVGLGPGHQIALFHRDGRLVTQFPAESGVIGRSYADFPLFRTHLTRAARGVYITSGGPVGYQRILSYDALEQQPLVVTLSQDLDVVLAGWRHLAAAAAGGLVVLALLLAAGVAQYLRAEEHRQRVRERLAQGEKMEALGQLTGSIAHDFANVLAIVATNLELLQRGSGPPPARVLERAQRAVATGTEMTRQLMAFARKREMVVVEADLNDAVTSVLPLLEQAAGQGMVLVPELQPRPARCRLDRSQLEVALINLTANARDAAGGRGRIVLRTGERAGRPDLVRLSVQDDGPGMEEAVRRRALEPFFTTKGEGGTGLGLAQVYGMMQQLGGDLTIVSAPGQGTTVHLDFPAAP